MLYSLVVFVYENGSHQPENLGLFSKPGGKQVGNMIFARFPFATKEQHNLTFGHSDIGKFYLKKEGISGTM